MSKPSFLYQASAKTWGTYHIVIGLSFGVLLGLFIYINPLDNTAPAWLTHTIGTLFMIGGFINTYKGLKLYKSGDTWHIEVNDEKVIYHTPASSREQSFEIPLSDIQSITTEVQPADAEAGDITYIIDKHGNKIYFGYTESLFNTTKFIRALSKAGVNVTKKDR